MITRVAERTSKLVKNASMKKMDRERSSEKNAESVNTDLEMLDECCNHSEEVSETLLENVKSNDLQRLTLQFPQALRSKS